LAIPELIGKLGVQQLMDEVSSAFVDEGSSLLSA
jgi:hypothetical protein